MFVLVFDMINALRVKLWVFWGLKLWTFYPSDSGDIYTFWTLLFWWSGETEESFSLDDINEG